jgi:hypothetical protein
LSCFSSSGSLPYCSSATLLKSPLRVNSSIWWRSLSISSAPGAALGLGLLGLPDLVVVGDLLLQLGDLFLDQRKRFCEASSFSRRTASRSICSWISGGPACP